MKPLSVRAKVFLPIAVLTLLYLLAFGAWVVDFRLLDRRLEQAAEEVDRLNALSFRLSQAEELQSLSLLSYPVSGQVEHLARMRVYNRRAQEVLVELEQALANDPRGRELVADYIATRAGLADMRGNLIDASRIGPGQALNAAFASWRLMHRRLEAMRRDLLAYINQYPARTLGSLAVAQERALTMFLVFSLLAAVLFLAAIAYYRRLITRPLERLTGATHAFARGELDTRVDLRRQDELGQLAGAFNGMASSLQETQAALEEGLRDREQRLAERERMAHRLQQSNAQLHATQAGLEEEVRRRQASQEALAREKERAQVTLMSIGDGVIASDRRGRVDYLNPVAEGLTGWRLEEAQGKPVSEVFRVQDEEDAQVPAEDLVTRSLASADSGALSGRGLLISRDGRELHIDQSAAPIRDHAGRVHGVVLVFHDVTESRQLSRQIAYQARHDALTGLINRREFELRLQNAVQGAREQDAAHVLLYLDLDRFKVVNDSCGHAAGDELLRELTANLSEHMRSRDTFARLGGDEFGVLLEHCQIERGLELAEEFRRQIQDFRFRWEDRIFTLGVSIGLVPICADSPEVPELLERADAACYLAKEAGRNRIEVATEAGEELAQRRQQGEWADRIRSALDSDDLALNYLRIVPAAAAEGGLQYEVLITLRVPGQEPAPPAAFLPAAERHGLMSQIDRWVLEHTLAWLAAHPGHVEQLELCTVNLSAQSVADESFAGFVADSLARHGVPPHKLCLEISEQVAVGSLTRTRKFMEAMRALGCRFSLDDFGSGFSSYDYVKQLPVDFLKIDGSFIKVINRDPMDRALVESINHIGHVLGKRTIAEYVESQAILEVLRGLGVDYAQGFGVGRPRPIDQLVDEPRASTG